MLALLDSNAWINFHQGNPERRRSRFKRGVRRGIVRPVLTPLVLSELAQASDLAAVDRTTCLRFAWGWSQGRTLLPDFVRKERELRRRRRLREAEAFYSADERRDAHSALYQPETAAWAQRVIPPAHAQHEIAERARLEATRAALGAADLREALEDVEARRSFARSWAADDIASRATELGVSPVDPDRAPTFLAANAVHVERIARVLLEDRTPVKPDLFDVQTLKDALAYCDVLVTDDGRLVALATAVSVAWPRLKVVQLDPWLEGLGV